MDIENWFNTNAKTVMFKLFQKRPVLDEEVELLGDSVLFDSHVEGAVDEILDYDYMQRIDRWVANIQAIKAMNDKQGLDRIILEKPMRSDVSNYTTISDGIDDLTKYVAEASALHSSVVIKHPFLEVRAILGDLGPGLHVIAGLPGSMKSGYTEQLELCISKEAKCGVYSLEMPKRQKLARYAQHIHGASVGPKAINSGIADLRLLQSASEELRTKKIFIDDKPENITQLINAMEMLQVKEAPDYYSVDFLQVLNPLPGETDYQAVKSNIKQLYAFAKRYSKPVYVLSQLNRESDKPEFGSWGKQKVDKVPKMRDLEGAGTIEQVAQNIMFIQQVEADRDVRRVYIAKNRDGEAPYDFENVAVTPEQMNFNFSLHANYK